MESVRALLPRIRGEYERAYYAGIICERKGSALRERGAPGAGPVVYEWLRQAMEHFERPEGIRPTGNDGSILRWNTCARVIMKRPQVRPVVEGPVMAMLEWGTGTISFLLPRGRDYPSNSRARAHTSSNIASVSLPVKVFCWLG